MPESGRIRILYMEDDPGSATLFRRTLEYHGYSVETASDGEAGLDALKTGSFDVVAVDMNMPVYDGLEVIRIMAERGPHLPTIMITGAGDEKTAADALKLGASDYVVKDLNGGYLDLLPSVIRQVLAKERLARDKQKAEDELRRAHDELERRVRERTAELEAKNLQLTAEIDTRKRTEQALRSGEELFATVFDAAQDSIFIKDKNLRYTRVNPAMSRRLGLEKHRIIGKTDRDVFEPGLAEETRNLELRVLGGRTIEADHAVTLNGVRMTLNCVRVPLRDSSGDVAGICGIARDVTERWKRETVEQVQEAEFLSLSMKAVLEKVRLAAGTDSLVLFLGESGTGKDYLARYLHDSSRRASGPFFSINCAALVPDLAESELFGHEAGAFTGSRGSKRGLLELAEGGTLLLNEVGELSPQLQAKLLTFLDTESFTRVGGEKSISVNARLVAATNRDLELEARQGYFRKDLYYRLNVFSVVVPPLRERAEDLPGLIGSSLASLAKRMALKTIPVLEPAAGEALVSYDWPGNVRELRNVLERALILCDKRTITVADLALGPTTASCGSAVLGTRSAPLSSSGSSFHEALEETGRVMVTDALRRSGGSIKAAAELLGMTRASFKHHMKSLGIKRS